jgi:hypothetical protein
MSIGEIKNPKISCCTSPCNSPGPAAYTGRNAAAKEERGMYRSNCGDVDDLIFQDSWIISDR